MARVGGGQSAGPSTRLGEEEGGRDGVVEEVEVVAASVQEAVEAGHDAPLMSMCQVGTSLAGGCRHRLGGAQKEEILEGARGECCWGDALCGPTGKAPSADFPSFGSLRDRVSGHSLRFPQGRNPRPIRLRSTLPLVSSIARDAVSASLLASPRLLLLIMIPHLTWADAAPSSSISSHTVRSSTA
jgi:hypothetical protein